MQVRNLISCFNDNLTFHPFRAEKLNISFIHYLFLKIYIFFPVLKLLHITSLFSDLIKNFNTSNPICLFCFNLCIVSLHVSFGILPLVFARCSPLFNICHTHNESNNQEKTPPHTFYIQCNSSFYSSLVSL